MVHRTLFYYDERIESISNYARANVTRTLSNYPQHLILKTYICLVKFKSSYTLLVKRLGNSCPKANVIQQTRIKTKQNKMKKFIRCSSWGQS